MTSQSSSEVWNCFQVSDNGNFANCSLCSAKISRGGGSHTTSGLWKHLKNKHPATFIILKGKSSPSQSPVSPLSLLSIEINMPPSPNNKESKPDSPPLVLSSALVESAPSPSSATSSSGEQNPFKAPPAKRKASMSEPTLKTFVDKMQSFKSEDSRATVITKLIAEMICKDNHPFSIVEDKGFRKLINHLEPRYIIPTRKNFANEIIPDMYEETKKKVENLLRETEFIGITTDMWTSSFDDYLSLTAHFLDKNFEYHHLCLGCIPFPEVSQQADIIQAFIIETIEEWNFSEKVVCVMRDIRPTVVAALERTSFNHVPCLAHTFQLVIKDGLLDKNEIKKLLSTCRKVVGHFKHSSKAMKVLRIAQEKLSLKPHRLIQDEPTRWNSQLHMLSCLMEQRQAITLAASDLNFQVDLSSRQWTTIDEVIKILDVFDRAIYVASSSQVTISEIIPLVNSTISILENFNSTLSSLQDFRNDLIVSLKKHYKSVEREILYAFATILDPRFKGSVFQNRENLEYAKLILIIEINDILHSRNAQQVSDESSEIEEQGIHSMWSFYSQLMTSNSPTNSYLTPQEEIENYLKDPLLHPSANIFKYWKDEMKYPNLKKLSKKYLITPPSTVFSERLFRTSGIIMDKKTSSLDPERVQMLVFLNKNLD